MLLCSIIFELYYAEFLKVRFHSSDLTLVPGQVGLAANNAVSSVHQSTTTNPGGLAHSMSGVSSPPPEPFIDPELEK